MLLLLRYAFILALIGVWVWCVLDVIRADAAAVKHLHKLVWLVLVVLVPTVGSIAWLLVGRPVRLGSRLVPPPRAQRPPPDDSPEFLRSVDEEIRRRRRADQLRRQPPTDPDDQARIDEELRRLEEQFRTEEPPGEDDR
jgi:hypothetical protein